MLSLFPSLLDFSFFAPTLLRITVGLLLIIEGYRRYRAPQRTKQALARLGSLAPIGLYAIVASELLIGASLVLGFLMQLGALLGLILALKMVFLRSYFPGLSSHSRSYWVLIAAVCAALTLTGAGAIAFDLPL